MPEEYRLVISAVYHAYRDFKIPKHISKDDIENYEIVYEVLYLYLKDGSRVEVESDDDVEQSLDTKRPAKADFDTMPFFVEEEEQEEESNFTIYPADKNGKPKKWCHVCEKFVSRGNFSTHVKTTKKHQGNLNN